MILTSVCANYIALSLSPGLHCTTGSRSPNLLLNQVVTLAAPGIRGPPPPITGGLGPKLVSTRICWSTASKATDSATAAPPCCTTALGCCHQLQSPTTTTTTTPSRPSTAASLPAHFACQPTNNLLCSLSCQEGAQLLLTVVAHNDDNDVHGAPVPLRLVAGWSFHLHRLALLCPTRAHPPYTHHTGHHILKHHHHNCRPAGPAPHTTQVSFEHEKALALPSTFDLSLSQTFLYSVHVTTR